MSLKYKYECTCATCGAATDGSAEAIMEAGWRKTYAGQEVLDADTWQRNYGDDCICPDCYAKYEALQKAADEAQEAAYEAIGKFTPTPSPSGGSGTEDDPYTFETGVVCVLNAYYKHDDRIYVYMPSDAEAKSYDSWEAAEPDFALWNE